MSKPNFHEVLRLQSAGFDPENEITAPAIFGKNAVLGPPKAFSG